MYNTHRGIILYFSQRKFESTWCDVSSVVIHRTQKEYVRLTFAKYFQWYDHLQTTFSSE